MAPSVWILALKEFNKGKGEWCVPRKGSPEYDEIKKIMDKLKGKEEQKKEEPENWRLSNEQIEKFTKEFEEKKKKLNNFEAEINKMQEEKKIKREEKKKKEEEQRPEEEKQLIKKILDDINNKINEYNQVIKKNDIIKLLNDNKGNSLYPELYNNFMSFRYNKNQVSKYKNNIKELNNIYNVLKKLYTELLTLLKKEEKQEELVKIELGNKNHKFSYEQIEEFKSQYNKDQQKTLREYLFEKKYSLERIFMLLDITKNEIQLFDAYFTPIDVSKKLIEKSGIENETKKNIDILEPTAGIGNIIMALLNKNYSNRKNYNIDCYEKLNNYYQIGKAIFTKNKNVNWFRDDFLKKDFNKKYDYIFTNPPFNLKNPYVNEEKPMKDIDFLNKSYKLLKDDGILCAIISNAYLTNKGDYKTFNDNLNSIKNIDKNNVLSYDVKGFNTVDETTVKDMKININMTMLIIKKVPNINLI